MAPARRRFDRLPIEVAAAVLETLEATRGNPKRLGKWLMFEHEGRLSARRGPYRVIYELDETQHLVRVVAIGHRRVVDRPLTDRALLPLTPPSPASVRPGALMGTSRAPGVLILRDPPPCPPRRPRVGCLVQLLLSSCDCGLRSNTTLLTVPVNA